MKNMSKFLTAVLVLAMGLVMVGAPAGATPGPQSTTPATCANEGYTGTQLNWCRNICEMGYTGTQLNMWIRRWVGRYRDLPYCLVE